MNGGVWYNKSKDCKERNCQMELLYELKSSLLTILPPSFFDILDIGVLTFLIYKIMKFMKGNRAGVLVKGVGILVLIYFAAKLFHMKALSFILENAFNIGLITLVILFQPELRRSLENVGQFGKGSGKNAKNIWENPIREICDACVFLSDHKLGAIIAIERMDSLEDQIKTGTVFSAGVKARILESLFFVNPIKHEYSSLHDCAIIIQNGMMSAAGCTLPLADRPDLVNKDFGSRHKAAIGMSEKSDAVVVVVSEETGAIRIALNGTLTGQLSKDDLNNLLTTLLIKNISQKSLEEKKPSDVKKDSDESRGKEEH